MMPHLQLMLGLKSKMTNTMDKFDRPTMMNKEIVHMESIMLPSERTLRDYDHWVQAKSGFSVDVDTQLMNR